LDYQLILPQIITVLEDYWVFWMYDGQPLGIDSVLLSLIGVNCLKVKQERRQI
jgi:hypothetical protein